LALSSRNAYLTPGDRAVAPTLYQALLAGRDAATRLTDAAAVRATMLATVAHQPTLHLDYAEVVDSVDLSPLTAIDRDARLLIAARLGSTRLIDNLAATGRTSWR
jgi:pantoate--beta-alanine ligase